MLESALGSYSSDILLDWDVPQSVDWDSAANRMPPSPDVWTDGSILRNEVSGSAFAGAGVYDRLHADSWRYRRWGHFDDPGLAPDGLSSSCLGFSSLPGPLQTVQRAATNAVHLGVGNLNVVRHVGRLLDGLSSVRPLELLDDGDLIILIRKLLSIRVRVGEGTVCISEFKGHADESLVRSGQVRALDRYGNSRADEAADFGCRRVWPDIADARRNLSGFVGGGILLFWFCIGSLLPSLVLLSNDSSGLTPHPLVWSAGGLPQRRRTADIVRDVALLPGPLHIWDSGWVRVLPVAISAEDVCLWQYSVYVLIKVVTFLGSLHCPSAGNDLVLVVFPMLSFLFFMSFGLVRGFSFRRLFLLVGGLIAQCQCRLFLLVQALIFGNLVSFLVQCALPGGLGRFIPCTIGANHCRLRHIGWIQSGHGLTSRPRETSDIWVLR